MDTSGVIQLISLIILIILSGFFSSAETALTTVNTVRMRSLAEEGNRRAAKVNRILGKYSKMLSAILIGNNIVNLSASALATTLAIRVNLAVGIATGILTFIILITGEIIPKTWAMINADKIAMAYCGIILNLMWILTPVIFIVDLLAKGILRLLGMDPSRRVNAMTENELKIYVDVGHEEGVIESEEREMIYNVFDFSDALAKDVMIPRINMVTIDVNSTYEEVLDTFRKHMYTRLPVYKEDQDNIIGFINIKDFILSRNPRAFSVEKNLRTAHYTYEFKHIADLMDEMRSKSLNLAFVLNEYGSTVGMITLEDLLEELVGEIRDEYDGDEAELIHKLSDGSFLIEGSMKLDDINDAIGTSFDSEDYDSIGGLIMEGLGRVPADGDTVTLDSGMTLKVVGTEQNRIKQVKITPPRETPAEPGAPESVATESENKNRK